MQTKNTFAIVPTKNRLWIGQDGRIVCTEHGGYYLQSAIENSPEKNHHITPLNDWEEIPSSVYVPGLDCEICVQG